MECRRELASDSPELRLELTYDDEPIVYCEACWEREFGVGRAGRRFRDTTETPPGHHGHTI
jgi:hypothetical protein